METTIEVYDRINSIDDINSLGKSIAFSGMFGCEKAEQGVVFALQCIAERKPPLEMCKTYHLINGKLSKRSDAMLAEFRRAGGKMLFADLKNPEIQSASIEFEGQKFETSYSIEDAKRAGLLPAKPGSGWVKHPAAMLRARLISETLRAIAPEIVQGAYTPEEIQDFDKPGRIKSEPAEYRPLKDARTGKVIKESIPAKTDSTKTALPIPSISIPEEVEALLISNELDVNKYLIERGKIEHGQTWRDLEAIDLKKIIKNTEQFINVCKA
jgi:hypothetical protein